MESSGDKIQELKTMGYDPVYVWNAEPNEEDPDHTHPFDTRLFIMDGEIEIRLGEKIITLRSTNEMDIPRGTVHSGKVGPKGCKYIVAERHHLDGLGNKG